MEQQRGPLCPDELTLAFALWHTKCGPVGMATRTTPHGGSSTQVQASDLRISATDAKARIDRGDAVLLDVVQPAAWNELDRVPAGAIRIPPDDIERRYQELPRAREVIAYCT